MLIYLYMWIFIDYRHAYTYICWRVLTTISSSRRSINNINSNWPFLPSVRPLISRRTPFRHIIDVHYNLIVPYVRQFVSNRCSRFGVTGLLYVYFCNAIEFGVCKSLFSIIAPVLTSESFLFVLFLSTRFVTGQQSSIFNTIII